MEKQKRRWLRALEIAKAIFESEGYHTIYLKEIEKEVIKMALKQIGVLWKKEGKKSSFLSGVLDLGILGVVNVGVFQTEKDENDNGKPDATIVLFEKEDD